MRIAWEGRELYCHISTKAGFDPVKTLYVCAPGADAASYEAAARFAQASGWREIAEQDGAVLVLPIVPHGWRAEDAGLLDNSDFTFQQSVERLVGLVRERL